MACLSALGKKYLPKNERGEKAKLLLKGYQDQLKYIEKSKCKKLEEKPDHEKIRSLLSSIDNLKDQIKFTKHSYDTQFRIKSTSSITQLEEIKTTLLTLLKGADVKVSPPKTSEQSKNVEILFLI